MSDTGSHQILSDSSQHSLAAARDAYMASRVVWWPGGQRCVLLSEEDAVIWGVKEGDLVLNGVPVLIDDPSPIDQGDRYR